MGEIKTLKIQFEIGINRRQLQAFAVLGALCLFAGDLEPESLTLTTSYPAPSGVYKDLIVTNNATLSRDSGQVQVGPVATGTTMDRSGNITSKGNIWANGAVSAVNGTYNYYSRSYLLGGDPNYNWLMAFGTTEGVNNALGFYNPGKLIVSGPGWQYGAITSNSNVNAAGAVTAGSLAVGGSASVGGDLYVGNNVNANDVYLRDVNRWASQSGVKAWSGVFAGSGWSGNWFIPLGWTPMAASCGANQIGRAGSWCQVICHYTWGPGWVYFWVGFDYGSGCCQGWCGTPGWQYDVMVVGQ